MLLSGSKEKGKSCCYIPAIANIGEKGDYTAFYIGDDAFKYKNAANEILARYISNNDPVLGYRQRKKLNVNNLHGFAIINIDERKYEYKVSHGDIITNEVYYYPFYYWELEYNGKTMCFMSLGNSNNIVYRDLPIEDKLRGGAKPVYVNATDCEEHVLFPGYLTLMVLLLLPYFYIYPDYNDIANLLQSCVSVIGRSDMFGDAGKRETNILITVVVCIMVFPLIIALISFLIGIMKKVVNGAVKLVGFFVVQLFAQMFNLYKRYKYIRMIMLIQRKKQSDAKNKFGIILNDLHINKEIPPFSFIF